MPGLQGRDYGSMTSRLKKDMSEAEVSSAIGSNPDKADVVTCGDQTANPWQCKTWIYEGDRARKTLRVIFYQPDRSEWRVASWQVY